MTSVIIDDTVPYTQSIASGSQTQFDTDWFADAASDVIVYARASAVAPNDVTQLVSPSSYVVSFVGVEEFVRVTFNVGRILNDVITLTRFTPPDRDNLYTNTNFTPSMLNGDFARLILMLQESQLYDQQLTPRYNTSSTIEPVVDIILPILVANQSWKKNSGNTALEAFTALKEPDLIPIKFIVQTTNALVPGAQSLGALTTGIVKNTTAASTGVLSISASLTSLDNLSLSANRLAYATNANTWGLTDFTDYSISLLALTTATAWRALLDVSASGAVQPLSAALTSIASLTTSADKMIYTSASNTYTTTDLTSFARTLLDDTDSATARATLALVIGTNVQAFDATLQSLSSLGASSDKIAYTTGVDTWAESTITAFGRSLIDDANAAAGAATLQVLPLAGGTMTGDLFIASDPTTGSMPVTLSYLNTRLENSESPCVCMADDLTGYTYNNGALGVGATLTAGVNGVFITDGITPSLTDRVLVNLSVNREYNGAYTVTTSTAGVPAVLTRATDYNEPSEIQAGDGFTVLQGTLYGASQWVMSQPINPIVIGTTTITFSQLAGQGALLKVNNLSDLVSAAAARTNLGLVIGTNVQAYDATLQSIASLGTAANKIIYTTGIDTWAESGINAFGRSIVDLTASNGGIVYSTAANAAILAGTATAGKMLRSGATAAPTWSTATYPDLASTTGNVITSNGTNFISSPPAITGDISFQTYLLIGA